MVFGLSSEKSSESRVDEMRELKNQVKLVELDLEKRMILLENSINSVQKTIGSIEQFESSKDALIEIQETKKTLRELEDTGLISKLETISNSDKINAITDTTEAINEKIKLLSDAIEILSESRQDNKNIGSSDPKEISSVKSEITSLKNALSRISSSMADPQKLSEFDERITSLEDADNALNAELKKTYEVYHEKINLLERRVSSVSPASGIPKEIPQDISKIKDEIEHMKGINKKLIEMIEINSRAFGDLKNLKTDGSKYNALSSMVTDLSMSVADIRKEIKLEHSMYPQDIMTLKKEMINVKSVQKNLVETMEAIAKMKHENTGLIKTQDHLNKIKNIENSIDDITGKITEANSLKDEIKAMKNEINSLKANRNQRIEMGAPSQKNVLLEDTLLNETNKKMNVLEKSLAQIHGEINGLQSLKEELKQVETRMTRIEGIGGKPQQYQSSPAEILDNEKTLSNMIKSVAEENRILKEEIEQLKQVCAEILKETQQQPIIID